MKVAFSKGKPKTGKGNRIPKKNAGKVHCLILLLVIEAVDSFRQFQKFGDKYNHGGSKNNPDHSTYLIPKLKDNHSISREMPAQITA